MGGGGRGDSRRPPLCWWPAGRAGGAGVGRRAVRAGGSRLPLPAVGWGSLARHFAAERGGGWRPGGGKASTFAPVLPPGLGASACFFFGSATFNGPPAAPAAFPLSLSAMPPFSTLHVHVSDIQGVRRHLSSVPLVVCRVALEAGTSLSALSLRLPLSPDSDGRQWLLQSTLPAHVLCTGLCSPRRPPPSAMWMATKGRRPVCTFSPTVAQIH